MLSGLVLITTPLFFTTTGKMPLFGIQIKVVINFLSSRRASDMYFNLNGNNVSNFTIVLGNDTHKAGLSNTS